MNRRASCDHILHLGSEIEILTRVLCTLNLGQLDLCSQVEIVSSLKQHPYLKRCSSPQAYWFSGDLSATYESGQTGKGTAA